LLALAILAGALGAYADEGATRVTFTSDDGSNHVVDGKVLMEAVDGGILLLDRTGSLWNVTPDQIENRVPTGENFEALPPDKLGKQLQSELGPGFDIVRTKHYVICSGTGRKYSRWCGSLFERLLSRFLTYWRVRDLDVAAPDAPLTAIVFPNERDFARFAAADAGPSAASAKGYYSQRTNRMVLYDLTAGRGRQPARTVDEVNERMETALFNVATIVHEATHQIAFNCGLHTRYADNPLWLTEGMAMYFETPDLRSRKGWRTVGKVNRMRLTRFLDYAVKRRQPDALVTLVTGDERFQGTTSLENTEKLKDTYAEAWALSYFLAKARRKEYAEYVKRISAKPRLIWDGSETRAQEFKEVFGDDLDKLDQQFLRYMRRLRRK
jgi:hypothetical protein